LAGAGTEIGLNGISFDSVHDSFAANIYRIGVVYWFGY
jgi:hypothetical protein